MSRDQKSLQSVVAWTMSRGIGKCHKPISQRPILLIITGSIGSGKSTLTQFLRQANIPVFDSDRIVHQLMAVGGRAVGRLAREFPESVKNNRLNQAYIDRVILGNLVFADGGRLRILESILHPMVEQERNKFLQNPPRLMPKGPRQRRIMAIDSPLYFEILQQKQSSNRCGFFKTRPNLVIMTNAPNFLQDQRVMKRPRMTIQKLAAIRTQQLPSREKSLRADATIPSGIGKAASRRRLRQILTTIRSIP